MKKCPPGVICIENATLGLFLLSILGIMMYIYTKMQIPYYGYGAAPVVQEIRIKEKPSAVPNVVMNPGFFMRPSYPYNNLPTKDVLLDPYSPPLRDERYFIPEMVRGPPGTIPINVSTNIGAVDTTYRQVGILTPLNTSNGEKILPLMGRPLFVNREKWQYYSMSEQFHSMKLPVIYKGKSATNEYGVDKLYQGDRVYVEGYNKPFRITLYDDDVIKYLPFL
jgi:hypothetical protein